MNGHTQASASGSGSAPSRGATFASSTTTTSTSAPSSEFTTTSDPSSSSVACAHTGAPQPHSDSHTDTSSEHEHEHEHGHDTAILISYFVAGGAAGTTSRTVVSPLERLKILQQVQPRPAAARGGRVRAGAGAYSGVWSGLVKMWREEGFAGFMRGNGINCLRIAPYSAVQFSSYEVLKNWLTNGEEKELDVPRRLTAGALAGIASVVSTYPLDLVRSRISIASASLYSEAKKAATPTTSGVSSGASNPTAVPNSSPAATVGPSSSVTLAQAVTTTADESAPAPSNAALRREIAARQSKMPGIVEMTVKVYREEGGIRGLYRGCVPTSMGVAPYVAINFTAYEAFRKQLTPPDADAPSTLRKLACGALAGSISQTLTYPLDVLRRRMQVAGMGASKLGYSDKNSFDAIRTIIRAEGLSGLYRGLTSNLLKVAPSIGTSFVTYEFVRSLLEPEHVEHGDSHS